MYQTIAETYDMDWVLAFKDVADRCVTAWSPRSESLPCIVAAAGEKVEMVMVDSGAGRSYLDVEPSMHQLQRTVRVR